MTWVADYNARRTFDPKNGLDLTYRSGKEYTEYFIKSKERIVIRFYASTKLIEKYDPPLIRNGRTYIEKFCRNVRDDVANKEFQSRKRLIIEQALLAHQGEWGIDTIRDGHPVYADVVVNFSQPSLPAVGE